MRIFVHPPDVDRLVPVANLEAAESTDGWLWIDVDDPDPSTVLSLAARYGFDRMAVEDVLEDTPLPKVVDYGPHLFVVLRGLGVEEERITTSEIDAFLGDRWLVTIHRDPMPMLEDVIARSTTVDGFASGGPDRALARIAEAIGRPFVRLVLRLDDEIDRLEDRALLGDPQVIADLQAIRRDVIGLRRAVVPQRAALATLARPDTTARISRRAALRFGDAHEQHLRVEQALDAARSLLMSIVDTYRSTAAEDMNRVMKVLTVFSAILLPLSLIAGIYGMNFEYMPELRWRYGYFAVLTVMALLAIGLWLAFARRGFIGAPRLRSLPRSVGTGLVRLVEFPVRTIENLVVPHHGAVHDGRQAPRRRDTRPATDDPSGAGRV